MIKNEEITAFPRSDFQCRRPAVSCMHSDQRKLDKLTPVSLYKWRCTNYVLRVLMLIPGNIAWQSSFYVGLPV